MKKFRLFALFSIFAIIASLPLHIVLSDTDPGLKQFAALNPIDTHTHVFQNDPAFPAMLNRLHLHLLDVLVASDKDPEFAQLQSNIDSALAVVHSSGGRVKWCTTFDPFRFNSPDFAAKAIDQLDRDFKNGAIAVKIWKNIGMELQTPDGKFVMPDDPVFTPIYREITAHHITLIAHMAEPDSCWQPLSKDNIDADYYKEHPEWYMYPKKGFPSKAAILDARDRLLAQNPNLRVVGAHLGSMEMDLDGLGQRFDKYPNFAVDTAARVVYLGTQPRDKVRAFLIKYQDRVIYGTDLGYRAKGESDSLESWESTYLRDWKFFSSSETVDFDGRKAQGLQLPDSVLRKLFHDNAAHWFPGIAK